RKDPAARQGLADRRGESLSQALRRTLKEQIAAATRLAGSRRRPAPRSPAAPRCAPSPSGRGVGGEGFPLNIESWNMADLIQPRTLKGFRDYLPQLMIPREHLLEQARRVYRSYGFAPIDTPALEYTEILLGKGGEESDKQLYRFTDHGGRDVALRFDL